MGWFSLAILFLIVTAACVTGRQLCGKHDKEKAARRAASLGPAIPNGRAIWTTAAAFAALIGLTFFTFSIVRSIPVKSVGVETSYGKVENDLRPGIHWFVAPWTQVHILDETVQTQAWYASSWDPKNTTCLVVRIGGQQLACVNLTVQWQIEDQAAPNLFANYDTSGNVQGTITNSLVITAIRSALNDVMGDYNPIADQTQLATSGANAQSQFSGFGRQFKALLIRELGSQIHIGRVTLTNAFYSGTTEARLAGIQNQIADTAIAQQLIATDQALAQANKQLAASLTPAIVQNNCITMTENIYKAGGHMNAGWTCSGSSSTGLAVTTPGG